MIWDEKRDLKIQATMSKMRMKRETRIHYPLFCVPALHNMIMTKRFVSDVHFSNLKFLNVGYTVLLLRLLSCIPLRVNYFLQSIA